MLLVRNLERSRVGRTWFAIRDDELASSTMGIDIPRTRLSAFVVGSALASLSGALWASFFSTSGEPGNYDFQVSIMSLCILIVGGIGSIAGVLIGAFLIVGFNSILLTWLGQLLAGITGGDSGNVLLSPTNWKYFVFGLALMVMVRVRPQGLVGGRRE